MIGWSQLLKRMSFYPDCTSSEPVDLLGGTMFLLQELVKKSLSKDKTPLLEEILLPYGMPMGINNQQVLKFLRNYKIFAQYDLSIEMNHRYKVYFVKMWFNQLSLDVQFHLIDNQLYLSKTEFLTRLNSNQYECFLNGFLGLDYHLDKYIGILPYFVKDQQSTLIRIHNSKGYPSVTYYSGDKKVQTKIESIVKQQNLLNFSKKQIS
ncbi:hypothetical protein AQPE_0377 [Aquipluma nitroreducens]|uniref:Uncharacterized protein n=1 Tax=Aquipluma nitroreducens TaxID=2010828 RepID=A0A5K7S437_9BACT|nr:hypothetical protein [Aquipluma nitroreducens]BBE16240.1 hypothetical protein AQPE_0377 [Aquipluma nitroreducens]